MNKNKKLAAEHIAAAEKSLELANIELANPSYNWTTVSHYIKKSRLLLDKAEEILNEETAKDLPVKEEPRDKHGRTFDEWAEDEFCR